MRYIDGVDRGGTLATSARLLPGRGRGAETRRRGLMVAILLTTSLAMGAYLTGRLLLAGIEGYTDGSPDPLPEVAMSKGDLEALARKLAAFRAAIESRRAAAPPALTLSSDELNALAAVAPGLGGKVRTEIVGDRVRARFSLPLEDLGYPQMHGRFLNGTSVLNLSISEGELVVSPQDFEVRNGPLPEAVMARLRKANLARLAFRDARAARSLRKLSSVEVRGRVVEIKAR